MGPGGSDRLLVRAAGAARRRAMLRRGCWLSRRGTGEAERAPHLRLLLDRVRRGLVEPGLELCRVGRHLVKAGLELRRVRGGLVQLRRRWRPRGRGGAGGARVCGGDGGRARGARRGAPLTRAGHPPNCRGCTGLKALCRVDAAPSNFKQNFPSPAPSVRRSQPPSCQSRP
jgi:hypothetical protein